MGGPIPVCLECPINSFTLSWALYDTNYAYPQFATGKEGDVAITYDKEKDSLYVVLADHIMGYSPYCLSVYPAVSDPIQQGANCISMIPLNKKRNSVSLKNLSDGTYVVGYDWRWGAFTPSFLFVKTSLQAIEKVQESACSVYQDGGYLHLSRRDASAEKIQVHLYDQMGRLLWSDVFLDSYSVPLFSFQRGIYFLQIDGQVSKFAVE